MPDQLPLEPVNVEPTFVAPEAAGARVLIGAEPTLAVAAEKWMVEPAVLVAVTLRRKNLLTWVLVGVKLLVVAPAIAVQPEGWVALALPVEVQLNQA